MKNTLTWMHFGAIILLMSMLAACDGADSEYLDDDSCYIIPQIVDVANDQSGSSCLVTFIIFDDSGNEYSYEWVTDSGNNPPLINLPKSNCYFGWIVDIGNGGEAASCGDITFGFGGATNNELDICIEITENVEERGDIYDPNQPEFSFCLDSTCSCPNVSTRD